MASRITCRSVDSCLDLVMAAFSMQVVRRDLLLKALYARSKTLTDRLRGERASNFLA